MVDTIQTYITFDGQTNIFAKNDLSDYCGCLYYLMGSGGTASGSFGGSSGYVTSGYLDFDYPYQIGQQSNPIGICLTITANSGSFINISALEVYFDDPSIGAAAVVIESNQGYVYTNTYSGGNNYIRSGFFSPTCSASQSFYNQRGKLIQGPTGSDGSITNFYGTGNTGGGGFYGSNLIDNNGYGYGSGSNGGTFGGSCAIVSLIPRAMCSQGSTGSTGTYFYGVPGSTGTSPNPSNLLLYSLLGGGGAGGAALDTSGLTPNHGAGGGGSGDLCNGFLNCNIGASGPNIVVGSGGTAPTINQGDDGAAGDVTSLQNINVIGGGGGNGINSGGPSGTNDNGNGGIGFFGGGGGGGGSSSDQNGLAGSSYTSMLTYFGELGPTAGWGGNGGGAVAGYGMGGDGTGTNFDCCGGGGGGFWGGNGVLNGVFQFGFVDGQGYGCGGGGSSYKDNSAATSGNGSGGYALLRYLDSPNIKLVTINPSNKATYFSLQKDFSSCKGFWFFLHGDTNGGTCKSYHNTGHFLIENDGVKSITCTFPRISNLTYSQIQVNFNILNGLPQVFTLQSSTGWTVSAGAYINILFYI